MHRRHFLAALPSLPFLAPALANAPAMKVTKVETFYWKDRADAPFWPHWTWLRLHTDTGLVAMGETYPRNAVEAEAIHAAIAPALLGRDPRDIERIWHSLYHQFDFQTAGGPLLFYASTHLSAAMPNNAIQESCQRFYEHDWPEMLVNPRLPKNGFISPPELPGLGMEVKPEVFNHPKVIRRESVLK